MGSQFDQVMYKFMKEQGIKLNLSGHFHAPSQGVVEGIFSNNPGMHNINELTLRKSEDGVRIKEKVVFEYVPAAQAEEEMNITNLEQPEEQVIAA